MLRGMESRRICNLQSPRARAAAAAAARRPPAPARASGGWAWPARPRPLAPIVCVGCECNKSCRGKRNGEPGPPANYHGALKPRGCDGHNQPPPSTCAHTQTPRGESPVSAPDDGWHAHPPACRDYRARAAAEGRVTDTPARGNDLVTSTRRRRQARTTPGRTRPNHRPADGPTGARGWPSKAGAKVARGRRCCPQHSSVSSRAAGPKTRGREVAAATLSTAQWAGRAC